MKNVRHFASGIPNRISFNIPSNEMSPLGYIIAQVYQAPSHYLNQCWQGSPAHKCVTPPHRVKPPYIHYTIPKNVSIGYIIAHVYQAPSHYLNQCWQGSLAHRCVTQPPWVNHPIYTQSSLVYIMVRGLVRRRAIIQTNDDRANWYMNAPISSIWWYTIYIQYTLGYAMAWAPTGLQANTQTNVQQFTRPTGPINSSQRLHMDWHRQIPRHLPSRLSWSGHRMVSAITINRKRLQSAITN